MTASVKGVARWQSDGSIRLTLSPVVDVPDWSVSAIVADSVTLDVDALPADELVAYPTSPGDPALVDVIVIVDTSEGMDWIIEPLMLAFERLQAAATVPGVEIRYGGLEFSDTMRTRSALGSAQELGNWLATLAPGGGAPPSSGIDAIAEAYTSFDFRPDALRYLLVLTSGGFHERSDGSGCSEWNLQDLQRLVGNDTLVAIVSLGFFTGVAGVHAAETAAALGGLFVNAGVFAPLQYDIAVQTPVLNDLLSGRQLVTIVFEPPAGAGPGSAARLSYTLNGEVFSEEFTLD